MKQFLKTSENEIFNNLPEGVFFPSKTDFEELIRTTMTQFLPASDLNLNKIQNDTVLKNELTQIINFVKLSFLDHGKLWFSFFRQERNVINKVDSRQVCIPSSTNKLNIGLPECYKKPETPSSSSESNSNSRTASSQKTEIENSQNETLDNLESENSDDRLLQNIPPENWLGDLDNLAETHPTYLNDRAEEIKNLSSFELNFSLADLQARIESKLDVKIDYSLDEFYGQIQSKVEAHRQAINFEPAS